MLNTQFYSILSTKLDNLKPGSRLFRLLKVKLQGKGYWKNKARGNPSSGYAKGWGKAKANRVD